MLSCDQALELISARLDGPLTQEETARLEEHLSVCPACRTLADELAELHEELPHLAVQPPAGLKEGVMGQIHASKVTPFQSKKRQWRWRSLASLAAVAALVLVGAGVMDQWRTNGFRGSEQASVAVESILPAGDNGEKSVTRELVPQPTQAQTESGSPESKVEDHSAQGGGQSGQSWPGTDVSEPAVVSQTPGVVGAEPYNVTPDDRGIQPAQATVNPFLAEAGLTQAQAVEKLAVYLGWPADSLTADSLTADSAGVLTGPGDDGVERTITCIGLNEAGTGWVCQVEEIQQGPDGTASCATYTVPLDGSEITQP